MKQKGLSLLPSALETWGVIFVALLLLLAGNAHDMLARYGLISSSEVVKNKLSQGVGTGLNKLDSFRFTPGVVTFLFWAAVGLVTLSIVQAVVRAIGQLSYEREIASDEYVHPVSFSREAFWRQAALHAAVSFLSLALLVTGCLIYLFSVLPFSLAHAGRFLLQVSLPHVWDFIVGLVVLVAATYVLYTIWKWVLWHHRHLLRNS